MTPLKHRTSRLRDIANMLREQGHEGWASELGQTAEPLRRIERSDQDAERRITQVHEHCQGRTPPYSKYCAQPAEPPQGRYVTAMTGRHIAAQPDYTLQEARRG